MLDFRRIAAITNAIQYLFVVTTGKYMIMTFFGIRKICFEQQFNCLNESFANNGLNLCKTTRKD